MDDQSDEEQLKQWVSRVTRRRFLLGLGFVTAASLTPPLLARAAKTIPNPTSGYPVINPPAGYPIAPVTFCLLGDFGAGRIINESGASVATMNPNPQAVAEGISLYAPKAGESYVVSLGDQIYIPYFGDKNPSVGNYMQWEAENITPFDEAIGTLYAQYIKFPADSKSVFASSGSSVQRFYAILGDHDWWHEPRTTVTAPGWAMDTTNYPPAPAPVSQLKFLLEGKDCFYNDYFSNQGEGSSSGNCRYWDTVNNDIHWIALSSDLNEVLLGTLNNAYYGETEPLPGNISAPQDNLHNSMQGQWFQEVTKTERARWRFVITHYPPYTSSSPKLYGHFSAHYMQWGYENFGVDLVFSGHVHSYERFYVNGVTYVACGSGGTFEPLAGFATPVGQNGSLVQVEMQYGFMTAEQSEGVIFFSYLSFKPEANPTQPNEQKRTLSDRFVLLKGGALTNKEAFANLKSIQVTPGGGAINGTGSYDFYGDLLGRGPLVKNGSCTLNLNGISPDYTGEFRVEDGIVHLNANNALPRSKLVLGTQGRLSIADKSQAFSAPLSVQGNATIALNAGCLLSFADSSQTDWSGGLAIQGTVGKGSIRFGTSSNGLTTGQLQLITRKSKPDRAQLDTEGYLFFS